MPTIPIRDHSLSSVAQKFGVFISGVVVGIEIGLVVDPGLESQLLPQDIVGIDDQLSFRPGFSMSQTTQGFDVCFFVIVELWAFLVRMTCKVEGHVAFCCFCIRKSVRARWCKAV